MSGTTRCALLSAILFTLPVVAQNADRKDEQTEPPSKSVVKSAAPTRGTVMASKLVGVNLKNHRDETVGEVENCLIDLHGQRAEFLIVSAGGFLGIGEHHAIMPFRAVSLRKEAEDGSLVATVDTTKERLKSAPAYDEDKWRSQIADANWRSTLESYYGVARDIDDFSSRGAKSFVTASELLGADVENASGEDVAEVEDLAIELGGGYVAYARLDFGGLLGIGEKSYPVPLTKISRVDGEDPRFVTTLKKTDLENAPTFSRGDGNEGKGAADPESPDFILSVHRFYHSEAPWAVRSDIDTASLGTQPVEITIRISDEQPHRFLVKVDTFTHVAGQREPARERDQRQNDASRNDGSAPDRNAASDRRAPSRQGESDEDLLRSGAVLGAAAARSVEAFGVELTGRGEADGGGKKIEVRISSAEHLDRSSASRSVESDERSTARGSEDAYTFTASVDEAGRISDVEIVGGQGEGEPGASEDTDSAAGKSDREEGVSAGQGASQRHGRMSKEKATRLAAWLVGAGLHGRELQPGAAIEADQLSPGARPLQGSAAAAEPGAHPSWAECVKDLALKFEGSSSDGAVFSIIAGTGHASKIEPASDRTRSRGLSSGRTAATADGENRSNRDQDRAQDSEDDSPSAGQLRPSTSHEHETNRLGTVVYSLEDGLLDWMAIRVAATMHEPGSHGDATSKKADADSQADTDTRDSGAEPKGSTPDKHWDLRHARTGVKLTIERL